MLPRIPSYDSTIPDEHAYHEPAALGSVGVRRTIFDASLRVDWSLRATRTLSRTGQKHAKYGVSHPRNRLTTGVYLNLYWRLSLLKPPASARDFRIDQSAFSISTTLSSPSARTPESNVTSRT